MREERRRYHFGNFESLGPRLLSAFSEPRDTVLLASGAVSATAETTNRAETATVVVILMTMCKRELEKRGLDTKPPRCFSALGGSVVPGALLAEVTS